MHNASFLVKVRQCVGRKDCRQYWGEAGRTIRDFRVVDLAIGLDYSQRIRYTIGDDRSAKADECGSQKPQKDLVLLGRLVQYFREPVVL